MSDKEKLESMGIIEDIAFELLELNGIFVVDIENRIVCDVTNGCNRVVRGLYGNLLKGKYIVKR